MGPKFRSTSTIYSLPSGPRYGYSFDNLLWSQSNPKRRGVYISGGRFMVTHKSLTGQLGQFPMFSGFVGSYPPMLTADVALPTSMPTGHGIILDPTTEFNRLQAYGATGWRRARPGNPIANAGQWLAELRDLPRLPGAAYAGLRRFSSLGSEYLNVQFGWAPFLGDLRKMYQLTLELDRRLMQLRRDNDRRIRRRRTLTDTTDVVVTQQTSLANVLAQYTDLPTLLVGRIPWRDTWFMESTTTTTKRWFVGAFRYYIENSMSPRWTNRAKAALFGLNPTPSLLWEVLPWSWLFGYFTNIGDAISNLSSNAVDNLVADYAYVMEEKKIRRERVANVGWSQYNSTPSGNCLISSVSEETTRMREVASPYGFGITYDGLSAYQMSILAALGLSRSRF